MCFCVIAMGVPAKSCFHRVHVKFELDAQKWPYKMVQFPIPKKFWKSEEIKESKIKMISFIPLALKLSHWLLRHPQKSSEHGLRFQVIWPLNIEPTLVKLTLSPTLPHSHPPFYMPCNPPW